MPINFPNSPSSNQVYTDTTTGVSYTYNSTYSVWAITNEASGAKVLVSAVQPSLYTANSLWWNSNTGRLLIYYNDGDTSQWVDATQVGEPGPEGPSGASASVDVGTTSILRPNQAPTVVNSGTSQNAILDFNLPRAYNVALGTTTTLTPNTPPTVTNGGNTTDIVLNFSIPRNNTTTVGTTTTGAPGSAATVTNSGTAADIVLDFSIPRGNTGNTGPISPKSVSILSPLAGDQITMFETNVALTLVEVTSVLVGGTTPTANFHISYGTSRTSGTNVFTSGCITGNTTFGQSNTSFNNSSIPTNGFVWVILNTVTGSPTEFHTTLRFTT